MSKTNFTEIGTKVFVSSSENGRVTDTLSPNTYMVCESMTGYFLEKIPDFTVPSKLYGNTNSRAERFITTFRDRPGTTGILLNGKKGSGKSLELKVTCLKAQRLGMPILVISSALAGDGFNKFIQQIDQPCVLVFDEFEKVYGNDSQEALLTLLDGNFTTKKLAIFTCNDKYKINEHMINRPGRIFYSILYSGLDEKFIREYCQDKLEDKSKIEHVVRASKLYGEFSFDSLQALVEELNRYNETVVEALNILNIKEEGYSSDVTYDVSIFNKAGEQITFEFYPKQIRNPFKSSNLCVELEVPVVSKSKKKSEDEETDTVFLQFSVYKDANVKEDLSEITITSDKVFNVKLTKHVAQSFHYVESMMNL